MYTIQPVVDVVYERTECLKNYVEIYSVQVCFQNGIVIYINLIC